MPGKEVGHDTKRGLVMRLIALVVVLVVALLAALAVALPSALSYKLAMDDYVVQIWQPDTVSGEPGILLAYGIVVDDGKHVLTVLDYERDTPDKLLVVSRKHRRYDASIQAIDYRTSATLLQLQDANLAVAEIGDTSSLASNQKVYVGGRVYWTNECMECSATAYIPAYTSGNISPLFFSISIPWKTSMAITKGKDWDIESGSVITNKDGKAIGLLGRYPSKLQPLMSFPVGYIYLPWAINIDSALELLIDTSHTNGPAISIIFRKLVIDGGIGLGGIDIVPGDALPVNDIENLATNITGLLDELGEPLPIDDLAQYSSGLPWGFYPEEGTMLIAAFTYPVELHDGGNNLLATAKWIGIHWDRSEGKPNRLIYGSAGYIVEGAYSIEGDISGLIQLLEPILSELDH
jgi:hypothetical protein